MCDLFTVKGPTAVQEIFLRNPGLWRVENHRRRSHGHLKIALYEKIKTLLMENMKAVDFCLKEHLLSTCLGSIRATGTETKRSNLELALRFGGTRVTRAFSPDSLCSQPPLIASPRRCRKRVHLHLLKGVSWPSFKIIWKSSWSIRDEIVRE